MPLCHLRRRRNGFNRSWRGLLNGLRFLGCNSFCFGDRLFRGGRFCGRNFRRSGFDFNIRRWNFSRLKHVFHLFKRLVDFRTSLIAGRR